MGSAITLLPIPIPLSRPPLVRENTGDKEEGKKSMVWGFPWPQTIIP